jgi:hypothetical protein
MIRIKHATGSKTLADQLNSFGKVYYLLTTDAVKAVLRFVSRNEPSARALEIVVDEAGAAELASALARAAPWRGEHNWDSLIRAERDKPAADWLREIAHKLSPLENED